MDGKDYKGYYSNPETGPVTLDKIKTKLNENGAWFGMDVIRVGNHWYRRKQGLITD